MARTQSSGEPRRLATAPRHLRRGPAEDVSRPASATQADATAPAATPSSEARTDQAEQVGAGAAQSAAAPTSAEGGQASEERTTGRRRALAPETSPATTTAPPVPPDEAPDTSPGALGSGSSPDDSPDSPDSPNDDEAAGSTGPEKSTAASKARKGEKAAPATTTDRPGTADADTDTDTDTDSSDSAEEPVISLRDVGVEFSRTRKDIGLRDLLFRRDTGPSRDAFWPLRNVSFDIAQGDAVGVIGRNGQGKSTLLKLVAGVLLPDEGEVAVRQGVAPLIEITGGFSPDLTGKENVYLAAGLHGMPKELIDEKYDEIVDFAEMKDFMDTPFRHYSSGMKVRLAFSVISQLEEPILLVDEVLAVGDKVFKKKCYDRIDSMLAEGRTMFLVSHSNSDLKRFCSRGLYLREGALRADGPIKDVLKQYDEQG